MNADSIGVVRLGGAGWLVMMSSSSPQLAKSRASWPGVVTALGAFVSFGIYLVGIILVVAGLVYAAMILHLPTPWIVVATLLALGIGVVAAVKATRQRDPVK